MKKLKKKLIKICTISLPNIFEGIWDTANWIPPTHSNSTLPPMKGPAKSLLGVIVSVSGNYVFSFLRNLDTDGHLLIAFNCNGKSFFVSGKWILEQFYYKCRKCASGLECAKTNNKI